MNFAPPPSSSSLIIHSSVDPARPDMCFWFDKCAIKTRRLAKRVFQAAEDGSLGACSAVMCALRSEEGRGGAELYGQRPMTELRGATLIRRGGRPPRFQTLPLRRPRRRLSGALVSSWRRSVVSLWCKDEKSHREGGRDGGMDRRLKNSQTSTPDAKRQTTNSSRVIFPRTYPPPEEGERRVLL